MDDTHNVLIPARFEVQEMCNFFRGLLDSASREPLYSSVCFDFSKLEFITPVGVTALANLLELLGNNGCKAYYQGPKGNYNRKNPVCYLDDSGFFERYANMRLYKGSACRSTTLPLKHLAFEDWNSWVENTVVPWIDSRIQSDVGEQFPELKTCFWEIQNNIMDHSEEKIASIFMQHYPYHKTIEIAISDFGVGIPRNVAKECYAETDADAIEIAIRDGFSTKSNPGNRGAGLGILIDNVTINNGGKIDIYSYNGHLSCCGNGDKVEYVKHSIDFYPGTLVRIVLNTDAILENDVDNQGEMVW